MTLLFYSFKCVPIHKYLIWELMVPVSLQSKHLWLGFVPNSLISDSPTVLLKKNKLHGVSLPWLPLRISDSFQKIALWEVLHLQKTLSKLFRDTGVCFKYHRFALLNMQLGGSQSCFPIKYKETLLWNFDFQAKWSRNLQMINLETETEYKYHIYTHI